MATQSNDQSNTARSTAPALDHIVRGIQDAVLAAQALAGEQHIKTLQQYFEEQPGTEESAGKQLRAKTVELWIPQPQKGVKPDGSVATAKVDVPLISLVPVQSLKLDELEIQMQLRIAHVNPRSKKGDGHLPDKDQEAEFKVEIGQTLPSKMGLRDSRMVDVKMKFTGVEPPEGMHRILDQLNESIVDHPNNS